MYKKRTSYGCKEDQFNIPASIYRPPSMTAAGIQSAINEAGKAGGGIVALKPGYYKLNKKLIFSRIANILFEGHADGTTLEYDDTRVQIALDIHDCVNVNLSNFNLICGREATVGVALHWCDNVLVDNVAIAGFRNAQIQLRWSQNVTVFSCKLTGATKNHGFACKDVYEKEEFASREEFDRQFGQNHPHGAKPSQSVAVLHCDLTGNKMYGINYHGCDAEFAYNKLACGTNGKHTCKVFDARNVLFHNNTINGGRFATMARTLGRWHKSGGIRIEDNIFKNNVLISITSNNMELGKIDYDGETQFIFGRNEWGNTVIRNAAHGRAMAFCRGSQAPPVNGGSIFIDCADQPSKPTPEPDPHLEAAKIIARLKQDIDLLESVIGGDP